MNPTLDEQNDFMMTEVVTEVECANLGKIYNNDVLHGKNLAVFIPEEVKAHNPQWIVAVGQCATVALNIRNQKKVLLNPKVSYDHLKYIILHHQETAAWKECQGDCQSRHQAIVCVSADRSSDHNHR